jgi:ureidoacrylate peracid hydrolase
MSQINLGDRYYPKTFAEKVDPNHTALIVIDMQNEFCSPDGYVAKQGWDITPMQSMAEQLKKFIDAARKHVKVIHIRGQYEPAFMPVAMVERLHRLNIPPYCQPRTKGVEFYPGFEPAPGEILITKRMFSAFAHTELDYLLRNIEVKTVVLTGTFTNVCVDSTARDAYFHNYYVILVDDLTACPDPELHRATLETLGHFFGVVVKSRELLSTWETFRI